MTDLKAALSGLAAHLKDAHGFERPALDGPQLRKIVGDDLGRTFYLEVALAWLEHCPEARAYLTGLGLGLGSGDALAAAAADPGGVPAPDLPPVRELPGGQVWAFAWGAWRAVVVDEVFGPVVKVVEVVPQGKVPRRTDLGREQVAGRYHDLIDRMAAEGGGVEFGRELGPRGPLSAALALGGDDDGETQEGPPAAAEKRPAG